MRGKLQRELEALGIPMLEFIPEIQIGGNDEEHDFVLIGANPIIQGESYGQAGKRDLMRPWTVGRSLLRLLFPDVGDALDPSAKSAASGEREQ